MKITLKAAEAKAIGLEGKETVIDVPMRPGNKPGVICPVGAGQMGAIFGPVRLSCWIKTPGSGSASGKAL